MAGCVERRGGATTALRQLIGMPLPPQDGARQERWLRELRASLGEEAFERAFAAGRALSWEQAIALALET